MNDFSILINILKRDCVEEYINFYKSHGISTMFSILGNGTASKHVLSYLGLEATEKIMLLTMVSSEIAKNLLYELVHKMGIEVPGNGIAITVPVGSIGGTSCVQYLTQGQKTKISEGREMCEINYALLTVILEKGYTETVMDAARKAGAGGGTVVHAKSTETEVAQKFFGLSIAAEKEIIYIVVNKKDKDDVMRSIMEKAGMHTEAHAAIFSVPVTDVVGLRSVRKEDGLNEIN